MTKRARIAGKKLKVRSTAHRRAMKTPKVRKLTYALQSQWDTLSPPERGDRLIALIALGCTRRGLERELNVSATNIRKHIALAGLPERDRDAIVAGASAKKILERKANDDRLRIHRQRVVDDFKTGALSNNVATVIIEFCRAREKPQRIPIDVEGFPRFLKEVFNYLTRLGPEVYLAPRTSRKDGLRDLFRKTRPRKVGDSPWVAYQAAWLANVIRVMAPERPIWESALAKAENRAKELIPEMKSPIEMWWDARRHSIELSKPTPRRVYVGGARAWIKPQGKQSPLINPHKAGS